MLNLMLHSLQPSHGAVNFILAQLYTGVNTIGKVGKLRQLDCALLQDLLAATVAALQAEIPGLGETVAFDVKHIYAWVKENNQRVYVKDRYDKTQRLAGDPDCRLGVYTIKAHLLSPASPSLHPRKHTSRPAQQKSAISR